MSDGDGKYDYINDNLADKELMSRTQDSRKLKVPSGQRVCEEKRDSPFELDARQISSRLPLSSR
jgi:hypothetical protein